MAIEEVDNTTYKKFRSRRWLISIWSICCITAIMLYTMFTNNDCLTGLAIGLSAIPIGFTSLETVRKWKKDTESE